MADGMVDIVVKAADDDHEVTLRVPVRATLGEVKQLLSEQVERPEVMETGKFVMTNSSGDQMPIAESQRIGPGRSFQFIGAPLFPPEEEPPPATIEDFDPYSEEQPIESPRTLKACEAEGIDPEELFYLPLKTFSRSGLPRRIVQLRHDLFEAFRQDTVEIVRHARELIIGEEEMPWKTSVASHGGTWGGALAARQYPTVHQVLEDLKAMMAVDKVTERPKVLPPPRGAAHGAKRWVPGGPTTWPSPPDKSEHVFAVVTAKDADLSQDAVELAAEEVEDRLAELKELPAGRGEQVAGLPLRTENVVTGQLEKGAARLRADSQARRGIVKKQVEVAEAQAGQVDDRMEEVEVRRELREAMTKSCMAPWSTPLQESRSSAAAAREEYWQGRRNALHYAQIDAEATRRERMTALVAKDVERNKRLAHMKDLTKIHFAKNWTDRRTAWGKNQLALKKGMDAFNTMVLHKHMEGTARVEDRRHRLQCLIDFKREVNSMRRALVDVAAERETRRQQYRRRAVADELHRRSQETSTALPGSTSRALSGWSSKASSHGALSMGSDTTQLSPKRKRGPRFDWGRFAAESSELRLPAVGHGFANSGNTVGKTSSQQSGTALRFRSSSEPMMRATGMMRSSLTTPS